MRRLTILLAIIFGILATCISSPAAFAQTTEQIAKGNCSMCASVCQDTLSYCTAQRGKYGEQTVTNALKDCITACKMTQEFLARGSFYEGKSAEICVEACTNCAKSCDGFQNDATMKSCADECRKTASNCQKIVALRTANR